MRELEEEKAVFEDRLRELEEEKTVIEVKLHAAEADSTASKKLLQTYEAVINKLGVKTESSEAADGELSQIQDSVSVKVVPALSLSRILDGKLKELTKDNTVLEIQVKQLSQEKLTFEAKTQEDITNLKAKVQELHSKLQEADAEKALSRKLAADFGDVGRGNKEENMPGNTFEDNTFEKVLQGRGS